jgi:hypothetical protein
MRYVVKTKNYDGDADMIVAKTLHVDEKEGTK